MRIGGDPKDLTISNQRLGTVASRAHLQAHGGRNGGLEPAVQQDASRTPDAVAQRLTWQNTKTRASRIQVPGRW